MLTNDRSGGHMSGWVSGLVILVDNRCLLLQSLIIRLFVTDLGLRFTMIVYLKTGRTVLPIASLSANCLL